MTRIRRQRSASEVAEWLAACETIARECDRILLACLTGHDSYEVSLDRIEALASTSLANPSGPWARRYVIRTMAAFRLLVADAARRPTEEVLARLAEARSVGFVSSGSRAVTSMRAARLALKWGNAKGCLGELDGETERLARDGRCRRLRRWFDENSAGLRAQALRALEGE